MNPENRFGPKLGRRSALALVAGVASLPNVLVSPAQGEQGREAEASRASSRPVRIVAVPLSELADDGFADRRAALHWVTAQAGDVDLVVFLAPRSVPNPNELQRMEDWARHHQSYIADGGMIGPNGAIVGYQSGNASVFPAAIGTVALLKNGSGFPETNGMEPQSPIDVVIVETGGDRLPGKDHRTSDVACGGAHTVCMRSNLTGGSSGPVILAPDGRPVTQAAGGWDHGVVATLNMTGRHRL